MQEFGKLIGEPDVLACISGLKDFERFTGNQINVVGGVSKNNEILQVLTDAFGMQVWWFIRQENIAIYKYLMKDRLGLEQIVIELQKISK
ncbi:7499_t:CDS:2, partial [Racocetra fulgida]